MEYGESENPLLLPMLMLKSGEIGRINCFQYATSKGGSELENIYVGTENGEIYTWNVHDATPKCKTKIGSSIQTIHFYDKYIITQEKEGFIKLHELKNDELVQIHETIESQPSFCKSIMISDFLFTASEHVDIHNMKTREKVKSLIVKDGQKLGVIMCITHIVKNGKDSLLTVSETGNGILWNFENSEIIDRVEFKPEPLSVTFEESKSRGLVVGASNIIQIYEVQTLSDKGTKILYEIDVPIKGTLSHVQSREDARLFVVGGTDGFLRCFSWKTLKLVAVLEMPSPVTHVCFLKHRYWTCTKPLAGSNADGSIYFWNIG